MGHILSMLMLTHSAMHVNVFKTPIHVYNYAYNMSAFVIRALPLELMQLQLRLWMVLKITYNARSR